MDNPVLPYCESVPFPVIVAPAEKAARTRRSVPRTHRVVVLDRAGDPALVMHVRAISETQARRAALDDIAAGIRIARCTEDDLIELGRLGYPVLDAAGCEIAAGATLAEGYGGTSAEDDAEISGFAARHAAAIAARGDSRAFMEPVEATIVREAA